MKLVSIFLILFGLNSLHAKVDIFPKISGASNVDMRTDSGIPIIYGGLGGYCESSNKKQTCNSCMGNKQTCNENRIHSDLDLTISASSDSADGVYLIVTIDDDNGTELASSSSTISKDSTGSVSIDWDTICSNLGSSISDCNSLTAGTAFNGNLRVGFDVDSDDDLDDNDDYAEVNIQVLKPSTTTSHNGHNCSVITGFCRFSAIAGYKSIHLNDILVSAQFPTIANSIEVTHIRVMYSDKSFNHTSETSNYQDLKVMDHGNSLNKGYIDNLVPNRPYVLNFASIDSTGNLFNFLDSASFITACGRTDLPPSELNSCQYSATPYK